MTKTNYSVDKITTFVNFEIWSKFQSFSKLLPKNRSIYKVEAYSTNSLKLESLQVNLDN